MGSVRGRDRLDKKISRSSSAMSVTISLLPDFKILRWFAGLQKKATTANDKASPVLLGSIVVILDKSNS